MKLEVVMKNKLFTSNVDFLLSNAILFVTGLIVTFFNIHLVLTASRIIGIVSLTLGIYLLYIFFFKQITGSSPFFIGFMCFITGLIMAIKPDLVISFLPMVIGVILIIGSLLQLKKTLLLRYNKHSISYCWLIFIFRSNSILIQYYKNCWNSYDSIFYLLHSWCFISR